MTKAETNIVVIDKLSVSYAREEQIIENLSLKIRSGEFISVIGRSGTGKSTLLNCIAGLIPYKGEIQRPDRFSYIFQDKSLFPWMSVKENIYFGLDDLSNAQKKRKLADILKIIGLPGFEKRYPRELSGGEMQRIAIARSLVYDHPLVLCDEPFSALDGLTKDSLVNWFADIIGQQKTFVFVTHSIEDAIILSDRIILLDDKGIAGEFIIDIHRSQRTALRFSKEITDYREKINNLINKINK
ncbi:ABC transporter ATP-binding protein [Pedobacter aquatilis]|uniref:ABC transporter ATP-binding protein n=1 Tax=Pedobacter aquatilis TaxID=351343 RepID=UPI00292E073D|nr:ABC transporter ATP-binding protein [Pedobacter aquatilis]